MFPNTENVFKYRKCTTEEYSKTCLYALFVPDFLSIGFESRALLKLNYLPPSCR